MGLPTPGLSHPLGSLDHVLAMAAVGLLWDHLLGPVCFSLKTLTGCVPGDDGLG